MTQYLFFITGTGTLLFALFAILLPLPLHAMISAMISLIFTAGLYLLLSTQFLAIVQLLIYIGAISVLLLFMILLLQLNQKQHQMRKRELIPPLMILPMFLLIIPRLLTDRTLETAPIASEKVFSITDIAYTIFGNGYSISPNTILLELLSLLLLISIIGAVFFAKKSLS